MARGCRICQPVYPGYRAWAWARRVAVGLAGLLLLALIQPVRAQTGGGLVEEGLYQVQAGDTLAGIAAGYGVPLLEILTDNGLRNPREIYPGQTLRIASLTTRSAAGWASHAVSWPDDAASLASRSATAWRSIALRNRLLAPALVLPGMSLLLPPLRANSTFHPRLTSAPRLSAAVECGVPLWQTFWQNPRPLAAGAPVAVSKACALTASGPAYRMALSPQPVTRGKTAWFVLEATEAGTCTFTWQGATEACHSDADQRYVGLIALSPMLEPGRYAIELAWSSESGSAEWSLPLLVTRGAYDYERIDLSPSRESLLDSSLSEAERAKIAALRTLRSSDRLWELPFQWPLEAAVTSYFGSRRSYGYGFSSFHAGSDFDGETGAPVLAPASGVVVLAEPLVVRGNAIVMDHGWAVVSGFWHLSRIDVVPGQVVQQGQVIGALGDTGLSTGPHLHWELWVNGVEVDPLTWVYEPPLEPGASP